MKEPGNTSEKIIQAAIELFRDYGYKGTTTRAVADKAGVNEVTIFRHFGNKKGLIEAAVRTISYHPILEKIIQDQITWDLEHDLQLISESYQSYMEQTKDLVMIGLRESELFPELQEAIMEIPKKLKEGMVSYFTEMKRRGKLIDTAIEYQAMNFIWLNFGYFLSRIRFHDRIISGSQADFIQHSVSLFSRGLKP